MLSTPLRPVAFARPIHRHLFGLATTPIWITPRCETRVVGFDLGGR